MSKILEPESISVFICVTWSYALNFQIPATACLSNRTQEHLKNMQSDKDAEAFARFQSQGSPRYELCAEILERSRKEPGCKINDLCFKFFVNIDMLLTFQQYRISQTSRSDMRPPLGLLPLRRLKSELLRWPIFEFLPTFATVQSGKKDKELLIPL